MNTALTESNLQANATAEMGEQYSLAKILGIWASVALPMGLILHGFDAVGLIIIFPMAIMSMLQ